MYVPNTDGIHYFKNYNLDCAKGEYISLLTSWMMMMIMMMTMHQKALLLGSEVLRCQVMRKIGMSRVNTDENIKKLNWLGSFIIKSSYNAQKLTVGNIISL